MIYMKEIETIDRCTNVAFQSFGICLNYPIIDGQDILKVVEKNFREFYVYHFDKMDYTIYKPVLKVLYGEGSDKFGKRIVGVNTINNFVSYLKKNKIFGHYYIWISGHVLAVHYLKSGKMYIVDAEEKFLSSKRIVNMISIEDRGLDSVFLNYLNTTENDKKVMVV